MYMTDQGAHDLPQPWVRFWAHGLDDMFSILYSQPRWWSGTFSPVGVAVHLDVLKRENIDNILKCVELCQNGVSSSR